MKSFFSFHLSIDHRKDAQTEPIVVTPESIQYNIADGGEFLDDALRMKEQPLMLTEESVAGSVYCSISIRK